jgi:hypothetical protein
MHQTYYACLGALLLAFCPAYWYYAASAETIIPGVALSIIPFYFLLIFRNKQTAVYLLIAAFLHATAVLMRQDNLLLILPFSLFIVLLGSSRRWKNLFLYLVVVLVCTGVGYYLAFRMVAGRTDSGEHFFRWTLQYVQEPSWGLWAHLGARGIKITIVRFLQSIGITSLYCGSLVATESIPARIVSVSSILSLVICSITAIFTWSAVRNCKTMERTLRAIILVSVVWVIIREAFYLWWVPETVFSWSVGSMMPFWLLICLAAMQNKRKIAAAGIALLTAAVFFQGALLTYYASQQTRIKRLSFFKTFSGENDFLFVRDLYDYEIATYFGRYGAEYIPPGWNEITRYLREERIGKQITHAVQRGGAAYLLSAPGDNCAHLDGVKTPVKEIGNVRLFPRVCTTGAEVTVWEVRKKNGRTPQ